MVHCVSSSEPDSADLITANSDNEWSTRNQMNSTPKLDFTDISSLGQIEINKKTNPTHVAFAESSTMISGMQLITEHIKAQEAVVSSRNFEKIVPKRKHSDALVVMETHHMHSSLFDDEEGILSKCFIYCRILLLHAYIHLLNKLLTSSFFHLPFYTQFHHSLRSQ